MKCAPDKKYEVAELLAADLAEKYIASNISNMMVSGAADKARAIRKLSDDNTDQFNPVVQEYRGARSAIYSAIWDLLDGYDGYKLIKEGN